MVFIGLFAVQMSAAPLAFEVASVRVNPSPGRGLGPIQFSRDGVTMRGVSLWLMVRWAYGIGNYQISGGDSMQMPPFYDVVAKASGTVPESQLRLMLRTLLAERFHLAVHEEKRKMAVTELEVAKGGVKFHESAGNYDPELGPEAPMQFLGYDSGVHIQRSREPGGRIRDSYTDISMPIFASLLELMGNKSPLDKLAVVDKTGLMGRYDFAIVFDLPLLSHEGDGAAPSDDVVADFKPVFERELGLTLGHGKATVDVLVVDRADKVPTAN
jgi:uncharacterized protein (TIGR03435 family)